MSETVRYLRAAPVHAECLAAIHAASVRSGEPAWQAMAFETLIARASAEAVIAVADDAPAGFVLWRTAADEAEILLIAVMPGQRRRGIGRGLLERAIGAARGDGAERLWLEVADDNQPAIALYRAHGFVPAGRRRGYYHRIDGPRADALVFGLAMSGVRK